jgi:CRP-like cAMP-binding protein
LVDHSRRDEVDRVLASSVCPFSGVGDEVRASLASAMEVRDYDAGDLLVRQGDQGSFLLVLIDGAASACVRQADGKVTPLAELRAGSVIGEMSLVTNEPRTADIICRTPVRAALLPVDAFDALALQYPELRALLTEVVAERLGQSPYDSLSGKGVNGYRIVRSVGRGGMGIVYEAVRLVDGERVALKMMNHGLLYQPKAVQRFQREADTLSSLSHRAIARLYGRFTAYKTQFLVLEFCQGTTLNIISAHGPMDESTVRQIVGQLADVLQYVHDHGVIHQDMKPSNVMLSDSGQVKLLDFGIAIADRTVSHSRGLNETTTRTFFPIERLGTPRYMAPEQFGSQDLDHRTDWYGLANVAYELLAGRPVIEASDLFAIIKERQEFVVPPASQIGLGVSREMHDFLVNALKPRREDRSVDLRQLAKWAKPVVVAH